VQHREHLGQGQATADQEEPQPHLDTERAGFDQELEFRLFPQEAHHPQIGQRLHGVDIALVGLRHAGKLINDLVVM
jgi:hypothetical protein